MNGDSGDPFADQSPRSRPEPPSDGKPIGSRRPGWSEIRSRLRLPEWSEIRSRFGRLTEHPHTQPESLRLAWVVAGLLVVAYWFTQWPLPRLLSSHPDYNFYLVQPVIWTGIGLLAVYGWLRLADRPRFSRLLVGIAFLVGVFHVAVFVIAGVLWSFGDSPIAGKLINYPKNFLFFATLLAAAEASRAYLFHVWRRWNESAAFIGTAVLLFGVAVAAAQWTPFDNLDYAMTVIGGRWMPALALSVLCTWLVSYGGIGPSFAYRLALVAFEWFSPILPNLGWMVLLLIGFGIPVASAWLISGIYADTTEGRERLPEPAAEEEEEEEEEPRPPWVRWTGWGATAAALLLIVLFVTGVFGTHLSVVEGISMEPAFKRGDLLIVREGVDPASLQVNDVVQFDQGTRPVVHRIVAIEEGPDGRVFTTKGDNVERPDDPIGADQIVGKVVFAIPFLGYPNLWLGGG